MLLSPLQPCLLASVHILVTARDYEAVNGRNPRSKAMFVSFGLLHIAQLPKPVDNLGKTVLHPGSLFRGFLRSIVREQTLCFYVFELYQKVRFVMRIADRQITGEITK